MPSTRIPSPARSQGALSTIKRHRFRASRSVGSPARSNTSAKLSSIIQEHKMDSFLLSPLRTRMSVLSDNTDIEVPRRKSWWKRLEEDSRDVIELLGNKESEQVENVEEYLDAEILSQEENNFTIDLPESSDSESISSIVIPQRKLFTQKDSQAQKLFGQIIDNRENLAHLHRSKTTFDKTINVGKKDLFNRRTKERSKPMFPATLLNTSVNKTLPTKTKKIDKKGQVISLFDNQPSTSRKSWWKRLEENSIDVLDSKESEQDENVEEHFDAEILSQEKKNYTIDLPESSDSESISSIVIPQRKLFTQKGSHEQKQFSQIMDNRENLTTKTKRTTNDTTSNVGKKNLFNKGTKGRSKPMFPAALLNISVNKTLPNETKTMEKLGEVRSLFGNRSSTRRKNMFAEFILSESEDEISDIQPKVLGTSKNIEQQRLKNTPSHKARDTSPTSDVTDIEIDEWKFLPSSTMVDNQFGNIEGGTPVKRARLSNLNETKETTKTNDNEINKSIAPKSVSKTCNRNGEDFIESRCSVHDDISNSESINNDVQNKSISISPKNYKSKNKSMKEASSAGDRSSDGSDINNIKQNQQVSTIKKHKEKSNVSQNLELEPDKLDKSLEQVENDNEDENDFTLQYENDNDNPTREDDKRITCNESNKEIIYNNEEELSGGNTTLQGNKSIQMSNALLSSPKLTRSLRSSSTSANKSELQNNSKNIQSNDTLHKHISSQSVNDKSRNSNEKQCSEKILEDNNEKNSSYNIDEPNKDLNFKLSVVNEETRKEPSSNEMKNNDKSQISSQKELDHTQKCQEAKSVRNESLQNISDSDLHKDKVEAVKLDDEEEPPEDIVHYVPNEMEFSANGRNTTSVRKTKSIIKINNIKLSLAPLRESTGFSNDGSNNSSAERSGWDSHRTTRKTLRQTFGKDFTPRKSLRALVMEKSAKRRTDGHDVTAKVPQACSTKLHMDVEMSEDDDANDYENDGKNCNNDVSKEPEQTSAESEHIENTEESTKENSEMYNRPSINASEQRHSTYGDMPEQSSDMSNVDVTEESDHEASRMRRQSAFEMYLQKMKKENVEKRRRAEEAVRNLLKQPTREPFNMFKVPARPNTAARLNNLKTEQTKTKKKQIKSSLIPIESLPPEVLEDMKYKPPRRYQPKNAAWATMRLYKYLETKLESKYDYKARVRAEKLVETIYSFTKEIRRHHVAPVDAVNVLKQEMARLNIVKTHFDFYEFFHEFMPRGIRIKVNPDVVNDISLPKHGVFSDIIP